MPAACNASTPQASCARHPNTHTRSPPKDGCLHPVHHTHSGAHAGCHGGEAVRAGLPVVAVAALATQRMSTATFAGAHCPYSLRLPLPLESSSSPRPSTHAASRACCLWWTTLPTTRLSSTMACSCTTRWVHVQPGRHSIIGEGEGMIEEH